MLRLLWAKLYTESWAYGFCRVTWTSVTLEKDDGSNGFPISNKESFLVDLSASHSSRFFQ